MTIQMGAFPHQFQKRSFLSSARTISSTMHSSHSSWMNHSGPMPLTLQAKYFTNPGTPSGSTEAPLTWLDTAVLK